MNLLSPDLDSLHRRQLLQRSSGALGMAALSTLLTREAAGSRSDAKTPTTHFAPRARRVVYLFQSGGPSHLELLDYKPNLAQLHGSELPD